MMEDDTTNSSLLNGSVLEQESDSSDEDTDIVPHEDSDQEGPDDELAPDEFNSKKLDLDAVVTLAAALFTSKASSLAARSFRFSRANQLGGRLTNRLHVESHERTVPVLDALAYVSVNKSSSAVGIGLTMKPLQLVVTTNEEIPSTTIIKHLDTICSILKNISDAKFCTCSDPNPQSNADLQEVSPPPDFFDENLESHYNNLFLQLYKYSNDRLDIKNRKSWTVIQEFQRQFIDWKTKVMRDRDIRYDLDEPHKTFFATLRSFGVSFFVLRRHLFRLSRSGWKMDATEVQGLRCRWHDMQTYALDILGQKVMGISMCDHWVTMVIEGSDNKEKPLQLRRAIEKMVTFNRHVRNLIWFANSKQMRSSSFSSKINVISAEKTHPSALSWPSNKREWGDLLGSIYHKHGLTRNIGSDVTKAEQKIKSRATKCGVAAIIHCECAMVAYLYKYAAFQSFSYIGVSKLCCKACHYWIGAFNRTMNTTFRTRGSHNKWYRGWARPGLGKAADQGKVDAVFLAFVEGELCKHQRGKRMARMSGAWNSSGSSESMGLVYHPSYGSDIDDAEIEILFREHFSQPFEDLYHW